MTPTHTLNINRQSQWSPRSHTGGRARNVSSKSSRGPQHRLTVGPPSDGREQSVPYHVRFRCAVRWGLDLHTKKKKRSFAPVTVGKNTNLPCSTLSVYRLLPLRFFFCPPQLLFCNRYKGERKESHVSRSLALSKWPFSDPTWVLLLFIFCSRSRFSLCFCILLVDWGDRICLSLVISFWGPIDVLSSSFFRNFLFFLFNFGVFREFWFDRFGLWRFLMLMSLYLDFTWLLRRSSELLVDRVYYL